MRTVVALGDQCVGLGFFFLLAEDEFFDIGVVNVQDDHLRSAAGLAAGFNDAGESVESFHEAKRTAGSAAAAETFCGRTQRRKVGAGA